MNHQPPPTSEETGENRATETPVVAASEPVAVEDRPPVDQSAPPLRRDNSVAIGLIIAVAFILGLALGFFGRPALIQDLPIEVVVTVAPNENEAVAQATSSDTPSEAGAAAEETVEETSEETISEEGAEQPAPDDEADDSIPTPTIMDFVMSDARHIQGDEAAPVTIVEFSDFN